MKYLDNTDNVFLAAEYAGTNMAVAGLIQVKGAVDHKRLERDLERFADGADRFRQRMVLGQGPFARPFWVPVGANFDIRNHLTVQPMPTSPGGMQAAVGQLMATPLSQDVPLWHVTCFDGGPASSYLLVRVSHVISDGQGLSRTFASLLTDRAPACPEKAHKAGRQFHGGKRRASSWPWRIVAFVAMVLIMIYNAVNVLLHPRRSLRAPTSAVRHQVGFGAGLKVSEVKELRHLAGTSFNDILVSCAASAIERHLRESGRLYDTRTLFMIPTSLRADHDSSLSNQSSAFTLSVPIGVEPIVRLKAVGRRMRRQKATWEPEILFLLGKLLWRWPSLLAKGALLAKYFNEVLVTNVPGPSSSEALYLGDLQIVSMTPIVCLAHRHSIGIGFLSFGDEVRFSVHMKLDEDGDDRAVYRSDGAQAIADQIVRSFQELREQVLASDDTKKVSNTVPTVSHPLAETRAC